MHVHRLGRDIEIVNKIERWTGQRPRHSPSAFGTTGGSASIKQRNQVRHVCLPRIETCRVRQGVQRLALACFAVEINPHWDPFYWKWREK